MNDGAREEELIAALGWEQPRVAVIPLGTPAAGAGFSYSPPGTEDTEIVSVFFHMVNAAVDGARLPTLSFVAPGGVTFAKVAAPFSSGNAITSEFLFSTDSQQFGANDAANIGAPIPRYKLVVGSKIVLAVTAKDVGDQITGVCVAVRQWPVRPGLTGYP